MSNINIDENNIVLALMSGKISIEEFIAWCEEENKKQEKEKKEWEP